VDGIDLADEAGERGAGRDTRDHEEFVILEGAHEPRLGFV
jgi:hypothetical protein